MHEWVGRVTRESARWGDHCFFLCQRRLVSFLVFCFFFLFPELEVEQDGEGVSGGEEKRREERTEETYDLDGAVPGTRAESILGHEVPMDGVDFPLMLLP